MLQSEIHTGKKGATRQSWDSSNPRPLLIQLARELPYADAEALEKAHLEAILDATNATGDTGFIRVLHGYWWNNNFRSILASDPKLRRSFLPPPTKPKTTVAATATAEAKSAIAAHIERSAKLVLLDTVLPNGKKLRNATGADCKGLAPKIGVWLGKIARKVKPDQAVGKVLSEREVRDIYDGA